MCRLAAICLPKHLHIVLCLLFPAGAEYEHEMSRLELLVCAGVRGTGCSGHSVLAGCQSYSNAMCSPDEFETDSASHKGQAESHMISDLGPDMDDYEKKLDCLYYLA